MPRTATPALPCAHASAGSMCALKKQAEKLRLV
jgi:hypothetical protein